MSAVRTGPSLNLATPSAGRRLHIALWVWQVLLAVRFVGGGVVLSFLPLEKVAKILPWVPDIHPSLARLVGVSELAAGLGILLPSMTRILPGLTPVAASGIALIQLLAMGFHFGRGETSILQLNGVYLGVALFVAWGRSVPKPIAPSP